MERLMVCVILDAGVNFNSDSLFFFFMVLSIRKCIRGNLFNFNSFTYAPSKTCCHAFCSAEVSHFERASIFYQEEKFLGPRNKSNFDILVARVFVGNSDNEVFQCLMHDQLCNAIQPSHDLIDKLLHRFKDDWKSASGIFRWAESRADYKHTVQAYDTMVDILGKAKQVDRMKALLKEMCEGQLIALNTVGKVMRRLAGAGKWEDAVRTFDELAIYGLEKNTESMNLLLDTLCKEGNIELAREVFLELKSHIPPNAHTFNIFIHGWCKFNRVDEAHWTIQEMKGYGCHPCIISYSTIVHFHCRQYNFGKVYELLDEMDADGCPPNVVTYTTIMSFLTKAKEFEEALQIAKRMKSAGCKPDTLFYNSLLHTLGRAGQLLEAIYVFKEEMPKSGVSPNTSTYNTMIAMLCHHAQEQNAFDLLKEMETSGHCKPDAQTYYPLLKLCFKTGKVDTLLKDLLDDMVHKHYLSLDLSTYTLLIHGLCRANKCEWAYQLFEAMTRQDIRPHHQTCCLLLDEVKLENMDAAADRIEAVMKNL